MRRFLTALFLFGIAALSGCGGGETTDPRSLKPLTAADIAEINARDTATESEEDGRRVEDPKAKVKATSRARR